MPRTADTVIGGHRFPAPYDEWNAHLNTPAALGCYFCGRSREEAGEPCEPKPTTPEQTAWFLAHDVDAARARVGYRPQSQEEPLRELASARAKLHAHLDEHGLAGSEWDDRVTR